MAPKEPLSATYSHVFAQHRGLLSATEPSSVNTTISATMSNFFKAFNFRNRHLMSLPIDPAGKPCYFGFPITLLVLSRFHGGNSSSKDNFCLIWSENHFLLLFRSRSANIFRFCSRFRSRNVVVWEPLSVLYASCECIFRPVRVACGNNDY